MSDLDKEKILKQDVADDELKAVSGGWAAGNGGCKESYYVQKCAATVEKGSWCNTNDWCNVFSVTYSTFTRDDIS